MYQLQQPQSFWKSRLWQLQAEYFAKAGIDAWRGGEVPHYITSNPVVGRAYAELVLAFLRDLARRGQVAETVYLLELGAGHGRLCYHFFKHFESCYERSAVELPPLCYVLSDFTEANLDFWKDHPRLQPYLGRGWLDFALFDVEKSCELALRSAGLTLAAHSLAQPLVVIANYVFDSIPQDLFRIGDGRLEGGLVSLATEADPATLDAAGLIEALELEYDYEAAEAPVYPGEPHLDELLEVYRQRLEDTHLLFPHVGLRGIERLRRLSRQGLVLLTADKGEHHLANLEGRAAPKLTTHGSFSLTVNYHALGAYCTAEGGLPLLPRHQHANLVFGCLLFLAEPAACRETLDAYERFVADYGPDDYFSLKKLIESRLDALSYRDVMAAVRLSAYDARLFRQMLPRLVELLPTLSEVERLNLLLAIPRIWDTFYPLGEPEDLAHDLGALLMVLGFFREALLYLEKSVMIYGRRANTLLEIAACHCLLGEFPEASPILAELRAQDPENEALAELTERFEEELGALERPDGRSAPDG